MENLGSATILHTKVGTAIDPTNTTIVMCGNPRTNQRYCKLALDLYFLLFMVSQTSSPAMESRQYSDSRDCDAGHGGFLRRNWWFMPCFGTKRLSILSLLFLTG